MASVLRRIKNSKLKRKLAVGTLAVSLLLPVHSPVVSAATDNEDLGYAEQDFNTIPYNDAGEVDTVIVPKAKGQPEIEVANEERILTIDGKKFKDSNANGELDTYEDWRLSVDKRVADLVDQMSLEQKSGLMLIDTHRMIEDFEDGVYVEADDEMIVDKDMRYVIFRQTPNLGLVANYNNQLQKIAEEQPLGIPVVITSNPRNHASTDYTNIGVAKGQHTFWPGPLGFAAAKDEEAVREFAEIAAKEWKAAGIRKIYGYTADIGTDPLWARIEDTFGENPEIAGDMIYNIVKGFQGDELGPDSVAITVKHFPGGGARDDGQDPHFENGNFNPYPTEGSLLKYHIPPFEKAIEAGVSSVMPYYAYPSNTSADQGLDWYKQTQQFEEVGFTLNEGILGFLRNDLGFEGYVNSDTGAVGGNAWGAEALEPHEKVAKAINAGTDIMSGNDDPSLLIQAVEEGLLTEETVNESVALLLTEMMNLGLFEDPYADPQEALDVVANEEAHEKAYEAHQKSVVLLRNDEINGEKLLPLTDEKIDDVKLYVEAFPSGEDGKATETLRTQIETHDESITLVDSLDEATHAFISVKPVQSNWDNNPRITIGEETGIEKVDRILEIQEAVPTIMDVNFTNQWVLDEIEPNAAALIGTFGTQPEAVIDVIRGKYEPTGKLPFALPADMDAVDAEIGDIPSYDEDPSFAYVNANGDAYAYDFGLTYNEETEKEEDENQEDENNEEENNMTFSDIEDSWAKEYIEKLASDGIIKGYVDGTFKPAQDMTRSEFTVQLVRALDLEGETYDNRFSDVTGDEWFNKNGELMAAVHAGIIEGNEKGEFAPTDDITRSEAAVMIERALELVDLDSSTFDETKKVSDFNDANIISDWAKDSVEKVYQTGIFEGNPDNEFDPNGKTTREQMAKIVAEFLEL
ncbi:glycoside hydrolase family 3 N-terminal domain-containing protein [Oceanobacillus senegalensis]|uniref:glycoside hydrolase family 3 N-terminal domain-containing protein n=1 Tax=Oceanobacillus senegalensis TaxID=1936063 RepID=UPI000A3062EF|nr:glycoside hydrolase family 3 N-terminal domain-containing protein [Oceanobacillus senegalensis]